MKQKHSILNLIQLLLITGFVGVWVVELVGYVADLHPSAVEECPEEAEECFEESDAFEDAFEIVMDRPVILTLKGLFPRRYEAVAATRSCWMGGCRMGWMIPLRL